MILPIISIRTRGGWIFVTIYDLLRTLALTSTNENAMILRLGDRKLLPLSEARTQIEAILVRDQTIEELRGKAQGITAEFNLKYLEAPTQPALSSVDD